MDTQDNSVQVFWFGAMFGVLIIALVIIGKVYVAPAIWGHEDATGCVIVTPTSHSVLWDPNYGEDDGWVYCPTGEYIDNSSREAREQ